jgi:hypothetical protein
MKLCSEKQNNKKFDFFLTHREILAYRQKYNNFLIHIFKILTHFLQKSMNKIFSKKKILVHGAHSKSIKNSELRNVDLGKIKIFMPVNKVKMRFFKFDDA